MESVRGYSGHFKHYAFIWRPAFTQRQTRIYPSIDQRSIDIVPTEEGLTLQQRLAAQTSLPQRRLTTKEIVDKFVKNRCSDDIGRYLDRNLNIKNFLEIANINLLRQPTALISKPMALVDDRNNDVRFHYEALNRAHLAGNCRPSNGPLNAHQLFVELSQERLPKNSVTVPAERRLIYVADLDPSCALSIAATSSITQAVFLRDFIHKHLVFRTLIGVDVYSPSPTGYSTFALEFHLPYYAWRRMDSMAKDTRQLPEGCTLRRSEETIRLQMNSETASATDKSHDYIYEAQLSIMVTGVDDWVWAAYCFADVYFKGKDHTETVEYYSKNDRDPHSCGVHPANPPIWIPREYYLRALSCRMEQVKQEWNNSVSRLSQQTQPYIYSFTREDADVTNCRMGDITQERGFRWTIRVLREFNYLISKTISAWDNFNNGEIRYFYKPNSDELAEASWGAYLAAIDKDVTELRDLRSSLQYQTELFENMTNSVSTISYLDRGLSRDALNIEL